MSGYRGRGPRYNEGDLIEVSQKGRIVGELLIIETKQSFGGPDIAISTDTQIPKLFEFQGGLEAIADEINEHLNEDEEGEYPEDEDGLSGDGSTKLAEIDFQDSGIYLTLPDSFSFQDFFNFYGYNLPEGKAAQVRAELDKFFR